MFNGIDFNGAEFNGAANRVILVEQAVAAEFAAWSTAGAIAVVAELLQLSRAVQPAAVLRPALTRGLQVGDALRAGYPKLAEDALALTANALTAALGLRHTEQVQLSPGVDPTTLRVPTLEEVVRFGDALRRVLGAEAADALEVAAVWLELYRAAGVINEDLSLIDTPDRSLVARIHTDDALDWTDEETLQALLSGHLADTLLVLSAPLGPSGGTTTWAVNARGNGVTEYLGYEFTSFAPMFPHYLAASDSGLYELDGSTDVGEDIIARVRTGYYQLAGAVRTTVDAAYLGVRGDGGFVLRVLTADGQRYDYALQGQSMRTTRVSLGRGLQARYLAFELESCGQDFDFDSLEILPVALSRRV